MPEIDPEDARATVRILRAVHGWNQTEMAERAGMEVSSVHRYEAGRPIPPGTLAQISEAAGVPERTLLALLLPTVRYLRDLTGGGPDPGDRRAEREIVEQQAARAGEAAAAAARGAFLRAWAAHVREALEHGDNAWRPNPADREAAVDLWQRMEPLSPAERDVLLRHGTAFHSWALAEKVADLAVEAAGQAAEQAVELADLAVRIANRVVGSEAWQARVRGYALAALCRALAKSGEASGSSEARGEAERLWVVGQPEPGPLSEARFRAAAEGGEACRRAGG